MKNIRSEALVWFQLVVFITIWGSLLYFSDTELKINWEALKRLPDVVSIYAILYLIFIKWAWKLPIFKGWLVVLPNVQGTWQGTLSSTWKDSNGKNIPPISIILVIKQSFSSISCVMYTEESSSYSTAAQINEDDDSGIFRLTYNYTNRPRAALRERSTIHDGAAILQIANKEPRSLTGEYWTSRKTTGDINLNFRTRNLLEKFPDDLIKKQEIKLS